MKSILIGMPNGSGVVPLPMVQSLLQLEKTMPCGFLAVERQRVDKARNYIVVEALKGNFDYVFFLDDDNPVPPETLRLMLEDDKDIVTVPILSRNPDEKGVHHLCSFYADELDTSIGPLKLYTPITEFKEEGPLHEIDATGTGCLLVKIEVLKTLFPIYQDCIFEFGDLRFDKVKKNGIEYDRRTMSEDCEFSERAINAGFKIFLDERIRPYHLSGVTAVRWGEKKNG